jgi:hypothetical protein
MLLLLLLLLMMMMVIMRSRRRTTTIVKVTPLMVPVCQDRVFTRRDGCLSILKAAASHMGARHVAVHACR